MPESLTTPDSWNIIFKHTRRWIILIVGFTILLLGIALIVLPGPAIIVIPLGLAILAGEFVWAKKVLDELRKKVQPYYFSKSLSPSVGSTGSASSLPATSSVKIVPVKIAPTDHSLHNDSNFNNTPNNTPNNSPYKDLNKNESMNLHHKNP